MFKSMKRIGAALMFAMMLAFVGAPVLGFDAPVAPVMEIEANNATGFLEGIKFNDNNELEDTQVGDGTTPVKFNDIAGRYKNIILFVTGILTITCFGLMIVQITKLAAAGDNEQARRKATMGILTTGIGLALMGSATIVIGFFYNSISGAAGGTTGG